MTGLFPAFSVLPHLYRFVNTVSSSLSSAPSRACLLIYHIYLLLSTIFLFFFIILNYCPFPLGYVPTARFILLPTSLTVKPSSVTHLPYLQLHFSPSLLLLGRVFGVFIGLNTVFTVFQARECIYPLVEMLKRLFENSQKRIYYYGNKYGDNKPVAKRN